MPRVSGFAHDKNGAYERTCPECDLVFRTNNHRIRYCSPACKTKFNFRRYYAKPKNRNHIQDRMRQYQRRRREEDQQRD